MVKGSPLMEKGLLMHTWEKWHGVHAMVIQALGEFSGILLLTVPRNLTPVSSPGANRVEHPLCLDWIYRIVLISCYVFSRTEMT